MSDRPNLLVITTDQQSFRMLSCAGNKWVRTPNMDRIAAWGTRVDRAYCANPVCVPSRFSLWTGRMPSALGIRENAMGPEAPPAVHQGALGHLLTAAGYTAAFGGKLHTPGCLTQTSMGFLDLTHDERDRLAIESARFIRGNHDRPWFLAANFINPHDICLQAIAAFPSSDFDRRLLEHCLVEQEELADALAFPAGCSEETFFNEHCPPLPPNWRPQTDEPEAVRRLIAGRPFRQKARAHWGERGWRLHCWAYARLTERVDTQIGVVLDALEASGQLENTVLMFTSDHGDHDAAHGLEHKTVFYEEAARIPLLLAHPGHGPSGVVDTQHLCNNGLDLMATCCDYAGIAPPDWNRGLSWRPLIEGQIAKWRTGVYSESQIGFMWVTRDHKYCAYDFCGAEEQLYDLITDPYETASCHQEPGKQVVLTQHRAALEAARAEHRALSVVSPTVV